MRPFLILGDPVDVHVNYVSWALETAGYETRLVNRSHDNCPARTTLYLDEASDGFATPDWDNAEAAWCRRLPGPAVVDESDDEDDAFVLSEERRFTKWVIEMQESSSSIRWINTPAAVWSAENKFLQLKNARSHGLSFPRTLITAQPDRFRAFLRAEDKIVAKPLNAYHWEYASGEVLAAFTNIIEGSRGAMLTDEDIARCVTVYQECIDKVADVRMLVMGEDAVAYKITQIGEQHLDFRIGFYQGEHLRYEPIAIPASLKKKVVEFVKSMKVNFASADFALTPGGEFVFLDLNPSGQWLFIEDGSLDLGVGQKFCSFFVSGVLDPNADHLFPSFSAYLKSHAARAWENLFQQRATIQVRQTGSWKEKQPAAESHYPEQPAVIA